jgi:hypothetical protein
LHLKADNDVMFRYPTLFPWEIEVIGNSGM